MQIGARDSLCFCLPLRRRRLSAATERAAYAVLCSGGQWRAGRLCPVADFCVCFAPCLQLFAHKWTVCGCCLHRQETALIGICGLRARKLDAASCQRKGEDKKELANKTEVN